MHGAEMRSKIPRAGGLFGMDLLEGDQVVGALTADAIQPGAFSGLDRRVLGMLGALAGAAMRTTFLIEALERTAERRGQVARELYRSAGLAGGGQILGDSLAVRRLADEIRTVAASDLPVLVTGETGVGKELVARQIHDLSPRRDEAMIQVNCAALPESVAESELFGHVKGAFTGAMRERAGKFEIAGGGTLFLDEVGELPLLLQPKLLRALQHGEVQRVGSDRSIRVDVRIIAASNRNLMAEVEAGRFRPDLYHRLAVYPIHVPPLRERRGDIPLLAAHFLDSCRQRLGLGPVRLADEARERLIAADWPGNVRELENVLSRGVLRAARGQAARAGTVIVGLEHLDLGASAGVEAPPAAQSREEAGAAPAPLAQRVDAYRRQVILAAVERCGGNWACTAATCTIWQPGLAWALGGPNRPAPGRRQDASLERRAAFAPRGLRTGPRRVPRQVRASATPARRGDLFGRCGNDRYYSKDCRSRRGGRHRASTG